RHLPTDDQHQGEARRRIQDLQVPAEDRETACAVKVHPRGRTGLAEEEQAHRSLDVPRVPRADGGGSDRARAAPDHGRAEDRRALLIAGRARLEDADDRAAVAALRASKRTIAVRRRASRPAVRQAADAGASANSRATVHKVGRVRSNQVAQPTRCCRSKNRTFKLRNVGSPSPQILQCVVFVTSSLTMFRIAVAGINVHSPTGYVNSVCRRRFGIRKGQATSDPCSENISRRVSVRYRMAFFGWPRAYEDQAERAVRARLEALAG